MSHLRAIVPLTLLTLTAPALASANGPDTSPFADRDRFVKILPDSKVRLSDCQIRVKRIYRAQMPDRPRPGNVNRNVSRKYYVFKAHEVEFNSQNKLVCRDGEDDDCIIRKYRSGDSGPYETTRVGIVDNLDKGYVRGHVGATTPTGAHRCTPFTLPGTEDYTWQWKGHDVESTARVSMSANSPAQHFRDTGTGTSSERYGICRVIVKGGTYIGTLREATINKVFFWVPDEFRFMVKRFSGGHSQDRQVCSIQSNGTTLNYHNFQYMTADIAESKWKSPGEDNSLPSNAFQAGTLDGEIVYACLKIETRRINNRTQRYRSAGWWKEGENTCNARNTSGTGTSSSFKILTN